MLVQIIPARVAHYHICLLVLIHPDSAVKIHWSPCAVDRLSEGGADISQCSGSTYLIRPISLSMVFAVRPIWVLADRWNWTYPRNPRSVCHTDIRTLLSGAREQYVTL